MPVFICLICAFFWYIMIFRVQIEIQDAMWGVAEEVSEYVYLCEQVSNLTNEEAEYVKLQDTGLASLITGGISKQYVLGRLKEELSDTDKVWKYIDGGSEGIKLRGMLSVPDSNGAVNLVVTYTVNNPFLPGSFGGMKLIQRCYVKAWTGYDIRDTKTPDTIVYVAEYGEVYHLTRECTYLSPRIMITANNLGNVRVGTTRYTPCSKCMEGSILAIIKPIVYVTEWGEKYHRNTSCSKLKRTVYEVSLDEAQKLYLVCKKCDKEIN